MILLAPMLASPIPDSVREARLDATEEDDSVNLEQKVDGHRRLTYVIDGEVIPLNRSGERTTLPLAMIKILGLQQINFAVDGELVGTGRDRRLWLFDLPWVEGLVDPADPFAERRAALETLHATLLFTAGGIDLLPSVNTPAGKRWLRNTLRLGGGEGVMIKPLDHRYRSGKTARGTEQRSLEVIKAKYRKTIDCVVTGLRVEGHDNIALGTFDEDGTIVDVGEVTAQAGDGPLIVRRFHEDPRTGRPAAPNTIVVEVTVLNVSAGGKLFQPTLPRLRLDRTPDSCRSSQLAMLRDDKTILVPTLQGGLRAAH